MTRTCRSMLALLLAAMTVLSVAPPAQAGAPAVASAGFSPRTGVIFNNPDGTAAQRQNILDYVGRSVDSAPRGSVIRIAVYSFFDQVLADQLVAAYRRGVLVRLLIDGHVSSPQIEQLRAALGHDLRSTSFLTSCQYGCMSSDPVSVMHAKVYLFSTAGRARQVTMIGSGNPNRIGQDNGWNNHYTVVGDPALYRSSLRYFNDMVQDRTVANYYRTTASGPYKLYFFPRAGSGARADTMYNVLKGVRCTGVAVGRGTGGRTVVRVAMFLWTARRLAIAQRLWQLHDQGCDVQVVYPSNTVEPRVTATLLKKSLRYGQLPVYDALRDRDGDGFWESYVHSKYVLVDGAYNSNAAATAVWAGSANFGGTGLRAGNEVTLKISGRAATAAYEANFAQIRAISRRVTAVPVATAHEKAAYRDGELAVTDDYGR